MEKCIVVNDDMIIYVYQNCSNTYEAEGKIYLFSSLVKAPVGIHTYIIDEESIWSAAALGINSEYIISVLKYYSKNILSPRITEYIKNEIRKFWTIKLYITSEVSILGNKESIKLIREYIKGKNIFFELENNEIIKVSLKDIYAIKKVLIDLNAYIIEINDKLEEKLLNFKTNIKLYEYQKNALNEILKERNNSIIARGIITMPPGSGKTIIGLKVIEELKVRTLILVENDYSCQNWINEIHDKTSFRGKIAVNEYKGELISIYTYKKAQSLLKEGYKKNWGLIIYDDARRLATPKNKMTAYISSKYKLALGSYLERDGSEVKVYRAIGPKLFNITLEEMKNKYGQIPVECTLILLPKINLKYYENENELKQIALQNIKIKVEALKVIDKVHIGKKVIVSHFKEVAYKIYEYIENSLIIHGVNNEISNEELIESVNKFNKNNINKIITTQIMEQLQLKEIEVVITTSIRGDSDRDEYVRIGKLKSSYPLCSGKKGYYYSLITKESSEEERYISTIRKMIKHGYNYSIITLEELNRSHEY